MKNKKDYPRTQAIYINAGRRGLLVRIDPKDMHKVLEIHGNGAHFYRK